MTDFCRKPAPSPHSLCSMERRILTLRNEHLLLVSRADILDRNGYYDMAESLRQRARRVRRILARLSARWSRPTVDTALSPAVLWPR